MIRHARALLALPPVLALAVTVIELPFRALLMPSIGPPTLLAAGLFTARCTAIAVSAIAVRADEKDGVTLLTETPSLKENRFAVSRRHALSQACLDNGTRFVAG